MDRAQFAARLTALLFDLDPVGINYGTNTDEYGSEAESITARLPGATTEQDAHQIVHEEFVRWFDADTAGPAESYAEVAKSVWSLWQRVDR